MQTHFYSLKKWFSEYTADYVSRFPECKDNLIFKIEHTQRVINESENISNSLDLSEEDRFLSNICALFHDIGRFKQYSTYKTFSDKKSINHALLGTQVLKENDTLKNIDNNTKEIIYKSIFNHNLPSVNPKEEHPILQFSQILRDADKLDIYKVITDYYLSNPEEKNTTLESAYPDSPEISDNIYDNLINHTIVDYRDIKTLNDYKLFRIGWIYDINFPYSINKIKEKNYMQILFKVLPTCKKTEDICESINNYLSKYE